MPWRLSNFHDQSTQIQLTFLQLIGQLTLPCQEILLRYRQSLSNRLGQHNTTFLFTRENWPFCHVLREHDGLFKPAGPQSMVMMIVSQQHGKRLVRQRADEGRHILRAVAGIHQQGSLFSLDEGHAHAHRIPDMGYAGTYVIQFKAHAPISFALVGVVFRQTAPDSCQDFGWILPDFAQFLQRMQQRL